MKFDPRGLAAVSALWALAAPAMADEGMWTFDNFPAARMREAYGWAPDQAWLDQVRAGSVRLETGCSGANVSAGGLVQTNHHCVEECVSDATRPGEDLFANGFLAATREEERRCHGFAVQIVTAISDVTARIATATASADAAGFARARDAEIAGIESACRGAAADKRCQVVTLYQGGRYALYEYKRYDDVRLVFAPELNAAQFGGDPDNFNFPRYCLDVAYLRLYENDAPAATPRHLSLRFSPLQAGESVLVSGNPGGTSRLQTSAQLAFERDYYLPWRIATLSELRGRLISFAALGPEQARIASDQLLSVENSFKVFSGRRLALIEAENFARIEAGEADLKARVRRNLAAQREMGDAWGEVERAQQAYRGFFLAHQYLEARAGGGSDLFAFARMLVRGAAERDKPDAERIPQFTSARLPSLEAQLLAEAPMRPMEEELLLSFWLSKMREYLTADDPLVKAVLGRESPEGLAHRLAATSRLGDPAVRRALWRGGAAAIAASDDPMIQFVRAWDEQARALRLKARDEVDGPIARAQERIARARFRAFGQTTYPDATFTLRLSYGRVDGWTEPGGGRAIGPFTQAAGLYERATGAEPYRLAPSWAAAQARVAPATIYNVSSSNDIIGGNSGSPLLDREGRVVGAVFDGNIHSLGGDYFYDPNVNRTVSVASTAIEAALRDVYGAQALLAELKGE